ncbi:MAG: hypothetical protein WEF86_02300 [Gemmatimonadota bacterium]
MTARRRMHVFMLPAAAAFALEWLIDAAHAHGLTITGHLDSGFRNSVNPRDAIMMGIDRVEHFLGGDAMPDTRPAYSSLVEMTPDMPGFQRIIALYREHGVYFDATRSAYGYYGAREPEVCTRDSSSRRACRGA